MKQTDAGIEIHKENIRRKLATRGNDMIFIANAEKKIIVEALSTKGEFTEQDMIEFGRACQYHDYNECNHIGEECIPQLFSQYREQKERK